MVERSKGEVDRSVMVALRWYIEGVAVVALWGLL